MPATRWRCWCRPRSWPSSTPHLHRADGRVSLRDRRALAFRHAPAAGETIERLAAGAVDIVIGTHRLVQPDVQFHNLGLVIIDEEQRFGVEVKERLKAHPADGGRADDDGHAHSRARCTWACWACATSPTWKRRRRTAWPSKRASPASSTS